MTRSFTFRDDGGNDLTVSETHEGQHVVILIQDGVDGTHGVSLTEEQWKQFVDLKWEIKFAAQSVLPATPQQPVEPMPVDELERPNRLTEEVAF